MNPARTGTKGALHYVLDLGPGEIGTITLWLASGDAFEERVPDYGHAGVLTRRQAEADAFYAAQTPAGTTAEDAVTVGAASSSTTGFSGSVVNVTGAPTATSPASLRATTQNV